MPTAFKDQFFLFDPANPPPPGTSVAFSRLELIDQNDDGDVDRFSGDSVNGQDVTASWPGDTVTINVPGSGNITYTGITFYLADGSRVFTPTDGQVLQNGTFQSSTFVNGQGPLNVPGDLGPTCFTPGVLIDTPEGTRAVETLEPGDPVLTVDHGVQRLRDVLSTQTRGIGVFAPVRITAGALGNTRDLIVSQQHRILLTGWKAQLYCGEDEVLVAARHLVNADTIHIMPQAQVTYIHLLFDRHELVMSEGIATESYFGAAPVRPGAEGTAAELCALFPHASAKGGTSPRTLARPALKHHESGLMLA